MAESIRSSRTCSNSTKPSATGDIVAGVRNSLYDALNGFQFHDVNTQKHQRVISMILQFRKYLAHSVGIEPGS
ncbi:MAG: hypothetical protein L0387_06780 [Acidobacteria bacterium]|nr:hypothetical protein [Acidobacteriota bacterium]MCI0720094.1 hypothetical protein [Acidobacteriota bacterium]